MHLKRNVLPMLLLQATSLLPRDSNIKLPPLQLQRQPLVTKEGSGQQVTGQDKENQQLLRASQVMKSLYLNINTVQNSILASMLDPGDSAWMSLSSKGNIDNIKQLMLSIDSLLNDEFLQPLFGLILVT
jgi:hypothetical protein